MDILLRDLSSLRDRSFRIDILKFLLFTMTPDLIRSFEGPQPRLEVPCRLPPLSLPSQCPSSLGPRSDVSRSYGVVPGLRHRPGFPDRLHRLSPGSLDISSTGYHPLKLRFRLLEPETGERDPPKEVYPLRLIFSPSSHVLLPHPPIRP